MSDDNVMSSFLMRLGFQVDAQQKKRFDDALEESRKGAHRLKLAMTGVAAAVATGVYKISEDFGKLYYDSKRVNASAKNLKAFQFAASQTGSSASEAAQAVQGLYKHLRESPGTEGMLQGLGVQTRNAEGHLRSGVKITQQLLDQLDRMPMYLAESYAQQLGIPEHLMLAHRKRAGEFARAGNEYKQSMAGIDFDRLARDARQFNNQMGHMRANLYMIGLAAVQSIEHDLGGNLKDLNQWFQTHGKEIAKSIGHWTTSAVHDIKSVVDEIESVNKATDGWLKTLGEIALVGATIRSTLKFTGAAWLLGGAAKGVGALARAGTRTGAAAEGAAEGVVGGAALRKGTPFLLRMLGIGSFSGASAGIASLLYWGGLADSTLDSDEAKKLSAYKHMIQGHSAAANNRRDLIAALKDRGVSKNSIAAIVANAGQESSFDPHAVGDHGHAHGLFQYHANRLHSAAQAFNFRRQEGVSMANANMAQRVDFLLKQLKLIKGGRVWRQMQNASTAREASKVFTVGYEAPKHKYDKADERAGYAGVDRTNLNVNVHVTGGGSDTREQAEKGAKAGAQSALAQHQHNMAVRNANPTAQ